MRILGWHNRASETPLGRNDPEFKADEVLVVPLLPGIDQRCRTIERIAQAYL